MTMRATAGTERMGETVTTATMEAMERTAEMAATAKTIHPPLWLSILIPVIVTLLLGRVFCSWMCPAALLFESCGAVSVSHSNAESVEADARGPHDHVVGVAIVKGGVSVDITG